MRQRPSTASKPLAVLTALVLGAGAFVGGGSVAVVGVPEAAHAATKAKATAKAKKYSVTMKLPKKASTAKRKIKVSFTPKKPTKVALQRWKAGKGGKKGKYVTLRTAKKPKGKSVTFTYAPAKGAKSRTKLRAVATWPKKHRAVTPGRTTTWTPASTSATRSPGSGLGANGDPTANINEPAALNACWSYGAADARCRTAAVNAINLGRTREGLRRFTLPANWTSLTAAQQMLVVSNDERAVRGLRAIARLSPSLNTLATTGAANNADPVLSGWTVDGKSAYGWVSNWAITPGGPLYSNFLWMYDDGIGSGNIDCTTANTGGCWGHRHNILAFGARDTSTQLVLGAAETRTTWSGWSGLSDATLLVKLAL